MKKKLSFKTVLALMMAAIMFCLPVGGLFVGTGSVLTVFASDGEVEEETEPVETAPEVPETTVSGNDVVAAECICEEKCCAHTINKDCPVCEEEYTKCTYVNPKVKITISTEGGWYNDSAKVNVNVTDIAASGNFTIQSVQAKISQNGSWTDITEDMSLEISENCSIYVLVTDQKGKTYEKNRAMTCFDKEKPTLNAAVSDGLLSIKAHDTDSGIKVIYVNGYEFTDFTNGTLNIRLQQFDAGYQYFTIQAMDYAGNMSEVYKTANPYYTDPEAESDGSEENPAEQLPVDAAPTKPTNATANVTEHIKVDSNGNEVKENTQKADTETVDGESTDAEGEEAERGKEFYTIQTRTDKVFYLVIDRDGEEEVVYFLTEISENDLLNVTTDNSETLPKNSAALESAIPVTEGALPNNNGEQTDTENPVEELPEDGENADTEEPGTEGEGETPAQTSNPMATYIIIGVIAVLGIGGGYYFKVVKGKKEQFIDEEEDEEEEIYEEEENEDSEDDFFDQTDDEEVE